MKTPLDFIIEKIVTHEFGPGFPTKGFSQACAYRIRTLVDRGTLDRYFSDEEIRLVQSGLVKPNPQHTFTGDHPECAYLVFSDDSLYYQNNADDEIWEFASDFITDRVLSYGEKEPSDFSPDSDEGKLIRCVSPHLLA
jgi:hypothetical protein